jgi:hypothetical protein
VILESREVLSLSHRGGRGDPHRGEGKALHIKAKRIKIKHRVLDKII